MSTYWHLGWSVAEIPLQRDKRRHFCPSCHQKRVVEFGEYLCQEILKAVPHRHFILSIPKILRRYFLYDRKILSDLSRCGWESLKVFFQETVSEEGAVPGAVMAIQRKKADHDELIPSILEAEGSSKEYRKNLARLIQKIYEVDPLTCPKCSGAMKVISVIEDGEVIKKILKHFGLWEIKERPPPKSGALEPNVRIDTSDSQVPPCEDHIYCDPECPCEAYAS
jgi:hypothetical protein